MASTVLRDAIEKLLGDDDLEQFVRTRRAQHMPWRRVALDVYDATGVAVTHESLRSWFPDDESAKAAG